MIQSTISDSAHSNSEELVDAVSAPEELVEAVRNPKSDSLVATHTCDGNEKDSATDTTNRNQPHKLLANRDIPAIIQGVTPPVHQATADGVSTCGGDLYVLLTVILEEIVTCAAPSAAHVFEDPMLVNWKVASRSIPIDMNTVGVSPISTTQVLIGNGTSVPPTRIRSQETVSPRGSIGPQEVRNAHPFKTSTNQFSPKQGNPTPIYRKAIGRKTVTDESADANSRCGMDLGRNSVVAKNPSFMYFGLSPANIPDKIKSVIVPTARVRRLTNVSNWLRPRHDIEEVTADRVRITKANSDYI